MQLKLKKVKKMQVTFNDLYDLKIWVKEAFAAYSETPISKLDNENGQWLEYYPEPIGHSTNYMHLNLGMFIHHIQIYPNFYLKWGADYYNKNLNK